jgi:hypothetical protein
VTTEENTFGLHLLILSDWVTKHFGKGSRGEENQHCGDGKWSLGLLTMMLQRDRVGGRRRRRGEERE